MSLSTWMAYGYGGKRAFVRHCTARLELALGRYREFTERDPRDAARLVFVCKGNICRSPFAEHLARRLGLNAVSAGLEADPGRPADAWAIAAARRHGVDLSGHRSRRVHARDVLDGDLIVAFEPEHARSLRAALPPGAPIVLLGKFCRMPYAYLHDPYGLSEQYFDTCFTRIAHAVHALQAQLVERQARATA